MRSHSSCASSTVVRTNAGDDEVLVEVKKTGMCGSDVSLVINILFAVDRSMNVDSLQGDFVVEKPMLCPKVIFAGSPLYDGTLGKYYKIPSDLAYKLPDNLTLEEGAMMEPLSVAVHSVSTLAKLRANQNVAIFGYGPVGLLCMAVAKALGASRIIAVDVPSRDEFAVKYAATGGFVPPPFEQGETKMVYSRRAAGLLKEKLGVDERGPKSLDLVIDASGAEVCIQMGLYLVKVGGTFLQVSVSLIDFVREMWLKMTGLIGWNGLRRGLNPDHTSSWVLSVKALLSIALVSSGKIDLKRLVTHRYDFDHAVEAFETTKLGKSPNGKPISEYDYQWARLVGSEREYTRRQDVVRSNQSRAAHILRSLDKVSTFPSFHFLSFLPSRLSFMATAGLSVLEHTSDAGSDVSHSLQDGGSQSHIHLRPRILRHETSQILSYYQSADAGRSEPEYRYPSPNPEPVSHSQSQSGKHRITDIRHSRDTIGSRTRTRTRSVSPSSSYSEDSVSDYGSPEAGRGLGTWENAGRETGWSRNKSLAGCNVEEDGAGGECNADSMDVEYGIALGSPIGDACPLKASSAMSTTACTETGSGIESGTVLERDDFSTTANGNSSADTGYGISRIIAQFQHGHRHGAATPAQEEQFNLSSPAFHQTQPQAQTSGPLEPREAEEQRTSITSQLERPALEASTVDSVTDPAFGFDGAPVSRRKASSRGASDKRRVAVVEMDSGTDAERDHKGEGEVRDGGTLSDGFGRVESQGAPYMAQQQARAEFLVQPLQSSISSYSSSAFSASSSHPPSAFASTNTGSRSTAVSALLARRGIVGNFAFVAPPDASPSAYTNLGYFTPPLSAPASAHPTPPLLARHAATSLTSNTTAASGRRQHQRSQSEAVLTTNAHGSISRSIPKPDRDSISSDSTSRGEKRSRPGHRLRKSSRDIGIVGTSTAISPTSGTMTTEVHLRRDESKTRTATSSDANTVQTAQLSPIFQTPSRSQTSLISSDGATEPSTSEYPAQSSSTSKEPKQYSHRHTSSSSGQGNGHAVISTTNSTASRSQRDENKSVAPGPDSSYMWPASNISSSSANPYYTSSGLPSPSYSYYSMATTASSSSISSPPTVLTMPAPAPSPYLYYQPGIHATAGPLPSPPRQIIPPKRDSPPPPRPPRLHAPNSGSSSLAKRRSDTSITSKQDPASSPAVRQPEVTAPIMTPSTTSSTLVNSQSDDSVKSKGHTREGAFPIDSVIISDATHALTRLSVKQDQQEQQKLKRKNTMDDLVRDVTAAIDEATSQTQRPNSISPPVETSSSTKTDPSPPTSKEQSLRERRSGMDLRREESRSTFKGGEPRSPDSPTSTYSDDDYDKVADITITKPLPDPLASSPQRLQRSDSQESGSISKPQKMLDLALKRFSALPRPPSRLSGTKLSPRSSISHDRASHERSDNGASAGHGNGFAPEQQRTPPRTKVVYVTKIRSRWPDAMQFADVLAKRTPLERSLGYARKINELANHDPGLGDWVVTTKHNLTVPGKGSSKRKSVSPVAVRSPSELSFTFQPRHPSRGSIGSEMTFPKRVDAYIATDLLPQRSEDDTLPRGPPPLPYPTLAQGPPPVHAQQQPSTRLGASASTRSNAPSLGSGKSSSGGGFFASIGRKASVKKDRPTLPGSQPNKLLSKRQQALPTPAPRPVQINVAPSLPGGPRAPPGRIQRAQSVIAPKAQPVESDTETSRRMLIKRSPSVAPSFAQNGLSQVAESASDIDVKIAKLADLLPHADKSILAGYLRRAGGMDMVAIGRYLDDEKNGVLIRE
ncbi:hypothetical protein ACEPAF_6440 [Sanghuangporus sanghuang]